VACWEAIPQLIEGELAAVFAVDGEASHVRTSGIGCTVVGDVSSLQAGSEQVSTGEAGVEVQPHPVAKVGDSFVVVQAYTMSEGVAGDKDGFSSQFGSGGELVGFEFGGASFQTVYSSAQGSEFGCKFFLQALQDG
jgi:hypothetical protein